MRHDASCSALPFLFPRTTASPLPDYCRTEERFAYLTFACDPRTGLGLPRATVWWGPFSPLVCSFVYEAQHGACLTPSGQWHWQDTSARPFLSQHLAKDSRTRMSRSRLFAAKFATAPPIKFGHNCLRLTVPNNLASLSRSRFVFLSPSLHVPKPRHDAVTGPTS
eukprot:g61433.t1